MNNRVSGVASYFFAVLFAVIGVSSSAAPQSKPRPMADDPAGSQQRVFALLTEQNKPLPAVALMEQMLKVDETGQINAQTLAQFYAVTGDERGTNVRFDEVFSHTGASPTDVSGYSPEPAIAAIVKAARGRRVVMLNELHHAQQHRAFSLQLAHVLRDIGFTHFGAEAFTTEPSELAESLEDGVPDGKTGYYTIDPLFADLVRQALAMGYELFPYEQRPDQEDSSNPSSIAVREQAQAENIKKVLDENPGAKIYIHGGPGHISETLDANGIAWMALRLKRLTGLDPLTVDQVAGTPRSAKKYDFSLYLGVEARFELKSPTIMRNKQGGWLSKPGNDITVFHPRTKYVKNRPDWLGMDGYRHPYELTLRPMTSRTLTRGFVASEPAEAIPMDQMLVAAGETSVTLMLPNGEYRLVRQTEAGENLPLGEVKVRKKD